MIYTFNDLAGFVNKAANYVAFRYRMYGVEHEDVMQEIYVWLYGQGRSRVERWLDSEPQQTTRIYRSMLDTALLYAESEKASKLGYLVHDVWWYTPATIENLLPLVLDFSFTQENGHVGELITMVIDIRKAVQEAGLVEFFETSNEESPDWRINIQLVLDRLGGERPAVGRRKAITNAQAQSITAEAYA